MEKIPILRLLVSRNAWVFAVIVSLSILAISFVNPSAFEKQHLDFHIYDAGARAERITTFDDVAQVNKFLERSHFQTNVSAPFPYGSPALIALVFVPLTHLSMAAALGIFMALSLGLFLSSLIRMSPKYWPLWVLAAAVTSPFVQSVKLGNWALITAALTIHAFCDYRAGKNVRAAVLIGCAAIFKVYPAFFFLPLVFKKQWKALGAGALTMAIVGFATLLLLGFGDFVHGWHVTLSSPPPVISRAFNMSLPGVVGYATKHPGLVQPLSALLLLATSFVVWRFRRLPLEQLLMMSVALVFLSAPLAWEQYVLALIPAVMIVMDRLSTREKIGFGIILLLLEGQSQYIEHFQFRAHRLWPHELGYSMFILPTYFVLLLLIGLLVCAGRDLPVSDSESIDSSHLTNV